MPTLLNWDSRARNVNQVALTLKPRKKRHSSGMTREGCPAFLGVKIRDCDSELPQSELWAASFRARKKNYRRPLGS